MTLPPPTLAQQVLLRQLLLTGFGDCIARHVPYNSHPELRSASNLSRRKRYTAYLSCNPQVHGFLYIHPSSCLYPNDPASNDLPEYIVYTSLTQSQRGDTLYMNCITEISPQWISSHLADCPLLKYSSILSSPSPFYDAERDEIMGYTIPKYGSQGWELSPVKVGLQEYTQRHSEDDSSNLSSSTAKRESILGFRKSDEVYRYSYIFRSLSPFFLMIVCIRWFGRLLLEGKVFSLTRSLSSSSTTSSRYNSLAHILKKENLHEPALSLTQMKASPKVSEFLRLLVKHEVCSRESLLCVLRVNPKFLSNEIQAFLRLEVRKEFRQIWQQQS